MILEIIATVIVFNMGFICGVWWKTIFYEKTQEELKALDAWNKKAKPLN